MGSYSPPAVVQRISGPVSLGEWRERSFRILMRLWNVPAGSESEFRECTFGRELLAHLALALLNAAVPSYYGLFLLCNAVL